MKREHHPIDDFFREELEGFSIPPSEKAREAFLKEAAKPSDNSQIRRRWFYTGLGLLLVSAILGLVFLYLSSDPYTRNTPDDNKPAKEMIRKSDLKDQTTDRSVASTLPTGTPEAAATHLKTDAAQADQPSASHKQANKPFVQTETSPALSFGEKTVIAQTGVFQQESPSPIQAVAAADSGTHSSFGNATTGDDTITLVTPGNSPTNPADSNDSAGTPDPSGGKAGKRPVSSGRKWDLTVGVQYSPEWMMNTLEGTKFVNNAGVEGTFHIGRYSITTGVGLSVSKGTNELAVAYNDYLGSYLKLDSMSFDWDERHYHLIPTYFMTEKDVWDSLMKLENARLVNQYTYLQIPLIFGYDFLVKGRFSMGARIGPILSLFLNTKRISGEYDPGKKQIISINEVTPEQVQTNWQVMAGFTATYRVNRWLILEVEPFGKYYFNSVYEPRNSSQKPWSIGIRTAILFNFLR
jgi:hypothetical protein